VSPLHIYSNSIYITISRNGILIIGIHVDDCLTAGTDQFLQTFKKKLRKHFPIKEMDFPNALLGIQLSHSGEAITLHQSAYLKRLVEDTGIEESNHVHTSIIVLQQSSINSPPLNNQQRESY
jgi:hypothetical protein